MEIQVNSILFASLCSRMVFGPYPPALSKHVSRIVEKKLQGARKGRIVLISHKLNRCGAIESNKMFTHTKGGTQRGNMVELLYGRTGREPR